MLHQSHFSNYGLGLLVIYAQDMQRAVAFYTALGLQFEQHAHPPCGEHFATTGAGCVFEIYARRKEAVSPMTFGFYVSDVDQAVTEASEHGGSIQRAPHTADWGRSATMNDPDGNRVLLMERVERPSS